MWELKKEFLQSSHVNDHEIAGIHIHSTHMFQKLDCFLSNVTLLPGASAQIWRHDPRTRICACPS